ncbi:glycosyltransferase family 2 protein [Gilvimarinus sp. SDUM040013]|nr:glycosyltransferase family 2 protein [Gilvimarinus sp. SDUM040013]
MRNITAIVTPFWGELLGGDIPYIGEAIKSVMEQSDPGWRMYIVDDATDSKVGKRLLDYAAADSRISVIRLEDNMGPANARNVGVRQAEIDGCDIVTFMDHDDVSSPNRISGVRGVFCEYPEVSVVYNGFYVIDENGGRIPEDQLLEGMRLLLKQQRDNPLEGADIWKVILQERDGLTIPSCLSVRTETASKIPFPDQFRCHEDTHTWVRYSAAGAIFKYISDLQTGYRVLEGGKTSQSRIHAGGVERFNEWRCIVAEDGCDKALELAGVSGDEAVKIKNNFLLNISSILMAEGSHKHASHLQKKVIS